jgi:hypothetical protein
VLLSGGDTLPTADDLDILIETAFQPIAVDDFIADLQALPFPALAAITDITYTPLADTPVIIQSQDAPSWPLAISTGAGLLCIVFVRIAYGRILKEGKYSDEFGMGHYSSSDSEAIPAKPLSVIYAQLQRPLGGPGDKKKRMLGSGARRKVPEMTPLGDTGDTVSELSRVSRARARAVASQQRR